MELDTVLKKLKLTQFYIGEIHRNDIFAVTKNGLRLYESSLVSEFVNALIHFNEKCRFLDLRRNADVSDSSQIGGDTSSFYDNVKYFDFHPLDISTVVFLCCDVVAKQDLVQRLWSCKLAFPFVIKAEQLDAPIVYIWSTIGLVHTFLQNSNHVEVGLCKPRFRTVSFLRFSKHDVSKSNIINIVLNKTEKIHSVFYHRDSEGSSRKRSELCEGMIEVFPHIDSENGPVLYFNLRGECNRHSSQRNFLRNASDVIIILCRTNELELIRDFVENQKTIACKKLVIIFTDVDINDDRENLISTLDTFSGSLKVSNNVVAYKGLSREDLKRELMTDIIKTKGEHTIDDLKTTAEDNFINADEDGIKDILIRSQTFLKTVLQTHSEGKFANIFPLQDDNALEWCKMDLEKYKLRLWNRKENVRQYRARLEEAQIEIRKLQLHMITAGKCELTDSFVKCLKCYKGIELEVFLRNSKLIIEKHTRLNMLILYEKYKKIFSDLRGQTPDAERNEAQFVSVEAQMTSQSLSLINFSRELGKIYEITILENVKLSEQESLNGTQLLNTAVKMLMCGYEIEIMDGRSNWVPIQWVQGILNELKSLLGNIRIKVISVLGVQSSGKSTLLNTMFGSHFAVGAGRCTRGMSLYLVKVLESAAKECLTDYIFVIDTEGLYSSVASVVEASERDKKERELATFAIGMSNVTIVNVMGENLTYLQEILPITVHAFLRMDLIGLRPKCRLLHHNVNKGMRDKLLEQTFSLKQQLDTYTAVACTLEKVPSKHFSEIIQFDPINDVDYFAPLFENIDGLDIVSSAYSNDVMRLKENLMSDMSSVGTLEDFMHKVNYLWNAVKKDDFVFEFRNTVETNARIIMDKRLCHLQWKTKGEFQRNLDHFLTQAVDCDTIESLIVTRDNYTKSTELQIRQQTEFNDKELFLRVDGHELLTEAVRKLHETNKHAIEQYTAECMQDFTSQFNQAFRYREKEIEVVRCNAFAFREIDAFIETHVSCEELTSLPDIEDLQFNKWLDELMQTQKVKPILGYEEDATDALYEIFGTRRNQVDKIIQVEGYFERNIETFLTEIPSNIWPYGLQIHHNEQYEQELAIQLVKDTQLFVKESIMKIRNKILYYRPDVFKDIALEVRNHHYIYNRDMHTKPDFEIKLVAVLCGEFIRQIESISEREQICSDRMMKIARNYFISRCRLKCNCLTNSTTAVKLFTETIKQELESAIITSLSQKVADYMKDNLHFLESKQMFLMHAFTEMLESEEVLLAYLISFEACTILIISKEVNTILSQGDGSKIQDIIWGYTRSFVNDVRENFTHAIEYFSNHKEHSNAIGQCVDAITLALKPFILQDICSFKQFELDKSDDVDPCIVLRQVLANLHSKDFLQNLNENIKTLVMRTYYSKIKNETVEKVCVTLNGCTEKCPLCGEPCCIGLRYHDEKHRAIMHKPSGFQGKCKGQTKYLEVSTCWEELEQLPTERHASHIAEKWIIPIDVSVDENSFWKFMFVKHGNSIASKYDVQVPSEIPDSWKRLTKSEELKKLEMQIRTSMLYR